MFYFDLCDDPGQTGGPYYYFLFNIGFIPFFVAAAICVYAYRLLVLKKKLSSFSLRNAFRRSIFACLETEYPKSSLLLYALLTYGVFLARPVGFLIYYALFTGVFGQDYISVLISSITGMFYFFSIVFMANFYGIKSEMIRSRGDIIVKTEERDIFLKMVLRRSISFSIIFFFASLLNILLKNPSFVLTNTSSNRMFDWALRTISSGFIAVLVINRLHYARYVKRMMKHQAMEKNKTYNVNTFNRHIESHLVTPEMLGRLLNSLENAPEEDFKKRFKDYLTGECERSSMIFIEKSKIINESSGTMHQHIVRNPMEDHLLGSVWLYFTLVDAIFNSVASPMIILYHILVGGNASAVVEQDPFPFALMMIMFGFYVLENTFQSILVYLIVRRKENFGDRIEVDSQRSGSSVDFGMTVSIGNTSGPIGTILPRESERQFLLGSSFPAMNHSHSE